MVPPRRTQAERRTATRAALVHAAVDVISRRGFVEATLQEIAEAAGVSKGSVSYHFGAKDELVGPVVDRCVAHLRALTAEAWRRGATPAERIRSVVRTVWDARHARPAVLGALVELSARARHDGRVRAEIAPRLAALEHALGTAIETSLGALGLRPRVPPAAAARVLLALLEGASLTPTARDGGRDDDAAAIAIETLVLSLVSL
jgi:AcrR family transcriptional regulator